MAAFHKYDANRGLYHANDRPIPSSNPTFGDHPVAVRKAVSSAW